MYLGPADETDPLQLADWLELEALRQSDSAASLGDLERRVHRGGMFGADGEALAGALADTLTEIEERHRSAGSAYPFTIQHDVLSLRGRWADNIPYVFCLLLSQLGYPQGTPTQPAARLFEEVSLVAARGYLAGEAFRFGSPRETPVRGFRRAVQQLQRLLGEGEGIRSRVTMTAQDDKLDIVAWRHHPDRMVGKLLLFAQCASGSDWETKTAELIPSAFVQKWIPGTIISPIIRGFFVPHRFPGTGDDWLDLTAEGGIVFDRCRTAYWASADPGGKKAPTWREHRDWVRSKLKELAR